MSTRSRDEPSSEAEVAADNTTAVISPAAQTAGTFPVSLSVKYWISEDPEHDCPTMSKVWDEKSESFQHPRNLEVVEVATPPVKPSPGDFSFTGMHDHGMLPKPKEGGPMSSLISFVAEARKLNDEYLTRVIEEEKLIREREEKRAKIFGD